MHYRCNRKLTCNAKDTIVLVLVSVVKNMMVLVLTSLVTIEEGKRKDDERERERVCVCEREREWVRERERGREKIVTNLHVNAFLIAWAWVWGMTLKLNEKPIPTHCQPLIIWNEPNPFWAHNWLCIATTLQETMLTDRQTDRQMVKNWVPEITKWGPCALHHWIQTTMEAILACLPSSIQKNDWLGGNFPYTMTYAHGPHLALFFGTICLYTCWHGREPWNCRIKSRALAVVRLDLLDSSINVFSLK